MTFGQRTGVDSAVPPRPGIPDEPPEQAVVRGARAVMIIEVDAGEEGKIP